MTVLSRLLRRRTPRNNALGFSLLLFLFLLMGAGCASLPVVEDDFAESDISEGAQEPVVVLPIDGYADRRTARAFGEYISDRFVGYHVGDDVEFVDVSDEVPVVAIMDGTIARLGKVSGYGGVAVIDHGDVSAIYGHIDLGSTTLKAGDRVMRGQFIANLGDHASGETDGERKHLHFALYAGEPTKINGYESQASAIGSWINPQNFFVEHGVDVTPSQRTYATADLGSDVFHLEFTVPAGMEAEYIPSLQALNIFTLTDEGSARDRSMLLIRYFDAAQFLTLSTVDVLSTTDLTIGEGEYRARRYEIAKKDSVADFADQPQWRNKQHIVTDFTAADGYGRYYVVAANPALDSAVYDAFLESMRITQ